LNDNRKLTRREFGAGILAAAGATAAAGAARSGKGDGFPAGNYTPFGYLDNPFHTWNLHRSGILRSIDGIGFSLHYPAGPGGYFDYARNNIYEAVLRLGFVIEGRRFWSPAELASVQLAASHHSKNLLTYDFTADGVSASVTFVQVTENALGAAVRLAPQSGAGRRVRVIAAQTLRLGGASWWGRDGIAAGRDAVSDCLWMRSFAAGPVFALAASKPGAAQFFGAHDEELERWMAGASTSTAATSYYPNPLQAAAFYELAAAGDAPGMLLITMARAANLHAALEHARSSLADVRGEIARKAAEDDSFWRGAPLLEGDWPEHWKHGWVYDFETLRMMVRRPIGVYRHPWDAMQIQAPRNVLAETSIDMWAMSYAAPDTAKEVFAGQFLDAVAPNIPCMREDGEMNMVAVDGSECGTSISWCFPYFCAASIFDRTRDDLWLRKIYPGLTRLLRWTLERRRDSGGFLVGRCSWETGMDASKRFLIEQPTGGELTDFVRLVELQAAAAQAGSILARFAQAAEDTGSIAEWRRVQRTFAAKTQQLWSGDWFHDFDTRAMKLVTTTGRDPAQSAPAFCGVATAEQRRLMRTTLRKFFDDSQALRGKPAGGWDDGLAWSSIVLPYVESVHAVGDGELAGEVTAAIAERIYRSMDRRAVNARPGAPKLGWPGVSCEIWGAQGAFGGEGYGWGAVMPAHIIRNIAGFRETASADEIQVCPNVPAFMAVTGKRYAIRGLHYGGDRVNLTLNVIGPRRIAVEFEWQGSARLRSVASLSGSAVQFSGNGNTWRFDSENHGRYLLRMERSR
jgi:hypothetical protein